MAAATNNYTVLRSGYHVGTAIGGVPKRFAQAGTQSAKGILSYEYWYHRAKDIGGINENRFKTRDHVRPNS